MESGIKNGLPRREVEVYGEILSVPRHVVRIDNTGTPLKPQNVHGWQVRYRGQTKYFKDDRGYPERSLEAAESYLNSIYQGPPQPFKQHEYDRKTEKVGTVGVRITHRQRAKAPKGAPVHEVCTQSQLVYVEVTHPMKGMPPKRLYVGKSGDVSDSIMKATLAEAGDIRNQMKRDFLEFRKTIPAWSEESTVDNYRKFLADKLAIPSE